MTSRVLLIRGLFRGKHHWGQFGEQIKCIRPDAAIIALDIPGVGELYDEISPDSIEGMVASLRGQLSGSGALDIIAISMGGMIALKWAEQYPEEINSIVCINASMVGISPFYQRLRPATYLKIAFALFAPLATRESLIYSMVSNQPINSDIIRHCVALNKRYPVTRLNFFRQLRAALRFTVKEKPRCRLLFIASRSDHLVSFKATTALALLWHEPLLVNEEDGHDIPLDNPAWLCQVLGDWFRT